MHVRIGRMSGRPRSAAGSSTEVGCSSGGWLHSTDGAVPGATLRASAKPLYRVSIPVAGADQFPVSSLPVQIHGDGRTQFAVAGEEHTLGSRRLPPHHLGLQFDVIPSLHQKIPQIEPIGSEGHLASGLDVRDLEEVIEPGQTGNPLGHQFEDQRTVAQLRLETTTDLGPEVSLGGLDLSHGRLRQPDPGPPVGDALRLATLRSARVVDSIEPQSASVETHCATLEVRIREWNLELEVEAEIETSQ